MCGSLYVEILSIKPVALIGCSLLRADEWDINKWEWEGVLKVVSKGENCHIRLEDKETGEFSLLSLAV